MPIIETIGAGISLAGIGNTLYSLVTGHTVSKKLKNISDKIEKLDRHIYYLAQQEVWDTSTSKQNKINDLPLIKEAMRPLQNSFRQELIVSQPIVIPSRLQAVFMRNPEELLFNIQPLKGAWSSRWLHK